jgi:hypothetical protein
VKGTRLITLRERTLRLVGVPSGDRLLNTETVNDAVNQAQMELDAEADWPWCEVIWPTAYTPPGGTLAMPEDWRKTRSVFQTETGMELSEMALTDVIGWDVSETGGPQVWTMTSDVMMLRPAPTQPVNLTVVYYRFSPQLINDTDETLMPMRFTGSIVAAAAAICANAQGDTTGVGRYRAAADQWLTRLRHAQRTGTKPVVPRVRVGGWL